jgi:hypothetical protein
MTLAEFRRSVKPEMEYVGGVWHSRMLPDHFKPGATGRYGYQKRKKRYSIIKARTVGHNRPLEHSGDLKAMVTRMARISSTGKGTRVAMSGPRYLYMYRKDYDAPHLADEIVATTEDQRTTMENLLDRRVTRRLNTITTAETVSSRSN